MSQSFSVPEACLRRIAATVVALVAVSASGWMGFGSWLDAPLPLQAPLLVELPPGGNLTQFLADLENRGVLLHSRMLRYHARLSGDANRVRAGEYRLERGITPRLLLEKLVSGDVVLYSVTLVEGLTVRQIVATLHGEAKLRAEIGSGVDSEWARTLGVDDARDIPEGLFFPDTYQYHLGMRDIDVLGAAYRRMAQVLAEEWDTRAPELPYRDPYEALIMASLIERETGLGTERAEIAGVFVRRLRLGMLLQTDPSVIYGLGGEFDGNLTRAHLRSPGPYNTYLNPGLPPTPIAAPGRAAIHAALHPADGKALYFVARGDGSHEFSESLEAHNRAVRVYQLGKRDARRR